MQTFLRVSCLSVMLLASTSWTGSLLAHAEAQAVEASEPPLMEASPVTREMNRHYYERLHRDPWRALGWEALFPGAGSAYNHIWSHAIFTLGVSVLGAGLWTTGAILGNDRLWWSGAALFAGGRTFGLVAAPVGALLLNAAFRRQLGIAQRF